MWLDQQHYPDTRLETHVIVDPYWRAQHPGLVAQPASISPNPPSSVSSWCPNVRRRRPESSAQAGEAVRWHECVSRLASSGNLGVDEGELRLSRGQYLAENEVESHEVYSQLPQPTVMPSRVTSAWTEHIKGLFPVRVASLSRHGPFSLRVSSSEYDGWMCLFPKQTDIVIEMANQLKLAKKPDHTHRCIFPPRIAITLPALQQSIESFPVDGLVIKRQCGIRLIDVYFADTSGWPVDTSWRP